MYVHSSELIAAYMPDGFGDYYGCKGLILRRENAGEQAKRKIQGCNDCCNGTHRDLRLRGVSRHSSR
jgi:hypothetical protein